MKQFILGLLLTLVGAVVSWGIAQYKLQDATGYLDYESWDRSSYVQLEDDLFKKIKFQYHDSDLDTWKNIPNISVATIRFDNSSKKHLDDVDVIFEFIEEQGKEYSLIGAKAQGPDSYDEKYITKLTDLDGNKIGYNFDTINISSDDPQDHFLVTFLFAGDVVPKIVPKVIKKGIKIRPLDRSSERTTLLGMVIIIYAATIALFLWWAITSTKKSTKRYQDDFDTKTKDFYESMKANGIPKLEVFVEKANTIRKESGKRDGLAKKVARKVVNWANNY